MDIKIENTFEFIPEWNNNRGSENPVIVTGNYLTNNQLDKCLKIGTEISIDRKQYLRESKIKISNLTVGGKPIVSGDDLLSSCGLSQLYTEITTHLIEINNQEPSKNS